MALTLGLAAGYVGWQGSQEASASALPGDALRRLSVGNVDFLGRVSADGRYLPFRYEGEVDLWVRDLVTGNDRRLTSSRTPSIERVGSTQISRDGQQIAYSWSTGPKSRELRIIGRDGSDQRVVYANEDVTSIVPEGWTPDGREILTRFQLTDGTYQLVFVSTVDGSVRVLKSLAWFPPYAELSPDGRYVAYTVSPASGVRPNIFLLAADGSQEVPLLDDPQNERALAWTPDGKGLIYRSNRTGLWDAWMMQIEDGRPRGSAQLVQSNIRGRNANIQGRGMSTDGTFYYALRTEHNDIYSATLDPVTGQVLVPSERIAPNLEGVPVFAPDFSRDGKYLAYTRQRPNDFRIMVRDLATGDERSIRDVSGYARWSPDGRFFLMNGLNVISLLNVETFEVTGVTGSEPLDPSSGRPLTAYNWRNWLRAQVPGVPGVFDLLPQWLPDGKAIVYLRRNQRTNSHHVLMRDLETGREQELYQAPNIRNIALSSDGEQLALWTETGGGVLALQIVPVAGGEPRELIRSGPRIYTVMLGWTPDGRHLLLAKRNDDPETQFPHELWRIATGGGEPESLGLKAEGGIFAVRVHPDGRRIVFTSGQRVTELLAAEDFLAGEQSSDE
jgi:Tol biopolymer transport system component